MTGTMRTRILVGFSVFFLAALRGFIAQAQTTYYFGRHDFATDRLKPAAVKAQIGAIGCHTFRHTYSTLLHALGTTPAVQKELLRHADIQTTLNIYTQAVTAEKRKAASKVVSALWKA